MVIEATDSPFTQKGRLREDRRVHVGVRSPERTRAFRA